MGTVGALDFIDTSLGPYIPNLNDPVTADTAELCLFRWVEGYLLDPGNMAPEFCRVTMLSFLGVP